MIITIAIIVIVIVIVIVINVNTNTNTNTNNDNKKQGLEDGVSVQVVVERPRDTLVAVNDVATTMKSLYTL